jgi:clan AA aspartic protease
LLARVLLGFTKTTVEVANPQQSEMRAEIELVVDSGATYSILSGDLLRKLQVTPLEERSFTLADGRQIRRKLGGVRMRIGNRYGFSSVIFGEETDQQVLGVTALEELGLELDPVTRQLRPTELFLL